MLRHCQKSLFTVDPSGFTRVFVTRCTQCILVHELAEPAVVPGIFQMLLPYREMPLEYI